MIPRRSMPWLAGSAAALLFLLAQALWIGPAGSALRAAAAAVPARLERTSAAAESDRVTENWSDGLRAAEALASEKMLEARRGLRRRAAALERPFGELRGRERLESEVVAGVYASQEDELRRGLRRTLESGGWSEDRLPEDPGFCDPQLPAEGEISKAELARATRMFRLQAQILLDLARAGAAPAGRTVVKPGVRTHRHGGLALAEDHVACTVLLAPARLPEVLRVLEDSGERGAHRSLLACEVAPAPRTDPPGSALLRVRAVVGIWRLEEEEGR